MSNKLSDYWKVPFRQVYCETFQQWLGETIYCHVVLRLYPPPASPLDNLPQ